MATLREIVDDILATANLSSDDNSVDRRSVKFWIKNKRAMLIRQQLEKRMLHSENYKQSIKCFELELHDILLSDCCIGLSDGCQVLRSINKIPKLLSYKGKYDLTVRPLTVIQRKFNFVSHDSWIYSGNSRFDSNDIYSTMVDDYLYVKSNSKSLQNILGKYLYLEGIFEDPEELRNFNNCDNSICFSEDEEYPIEDWMIDVIKQEIMRVELFINLNAQEDKQNDSETTISGQAQPKVR